jgi:hypothetical protein
MTGRRTTQAGPQRVVVTTERHGRRLYLTLACGHLKLHQDRNQVPRVAHCQECAR